MGSARKLARLCREHDAFRWLCGGVPVDYHLLSDFRVEHQEALDELLTKIVATLMAESLVTLKEVVQDGLRVRASAGSGSLRRKARLEEFLEAARARVEQALAQMPAMEAAKERQAKHGGKARQARLRVPRVSTADPETRVTPIASGWPTAASGLRTRSSWLRMLPARSSSGWQ